MRPWLLIAAAVYFRKRYPLASFGFLSALLLFAPTSSVVPLLDAVAERRLYLPMLGLVLIPVEVLNRWRVSQRVAAGTAAAVLLVFAFLCYQRSQVWASDVSLWEDAVAKSPDNWRAHFQLGIAYYQKSRCDVAAREYETAFRLGKPDYRLHVDWALAQECLGRPELALDQLRKAGAIKRSAYVYSQMGLIYGKQGKTAEALSAAETALQIDPRDDMAYFCRGNLRVLAGDIAGAQADYRKAVEIKPDIVGLSGLITASFETMKETVQELRKKARDGGVSFPIIIGGGMIDEQVSQYVGADYWVPDAMSGVRLCQKLMEESRKNTG